MKLNKEQLLAIQCVMSRAQPRHGMMWWCEAPPYAGWWLTTTKFSVAPLWRWWDGHVWSQPVSQHETALAAGRAARRPSVEPPESIMFSPLYPNRARVPRNPPTVETMNVKKKKT